MLLKFERIIPTHNQNDELFILLKNLRHVFASGDPEEYLLDDNALKSFLNHCNKTIGSAYFTTPRNTIKAFINLLSVLEQNPQMDWQDFIANTSIEAEKPSDMEDDETAQGGENSELASFKL